MSFGNEVAQGTLVALETAEQVEAWLMRRGNDANVVALSAEADDALDRNAVPHATIEDFYDEAELIRAARNSNAIAEEICTELDHALGVSFEGQLPAFSARYHRARVRILYDGFRRVAHCLGRLLDAISSSRAIIGAAAAPDASEVWIRDRRFSSFVLAHMALARGIAVERVGTIASGRLSGFSAKAYALDFARRVRDRLSAIRPQAGDVAYFFWPGMPARSLQERGVRPVRLPGRSFACVAAQTTDLSGLERFFHFQGDNLFPLARPHLEALAGGFRAASVAHLRPVERAFRRSGARAAVATAALNIEAVNALLAARRAGRPGIVLQHGGFNGYARFDILPFSEFGLNDHYLCYGPGVVETVSTDTRATSIIRDRPVETRIVGSPPLREIFLRRTRPIPSATRRAIYVAGPLVGSSRYLAGHMRPDIALFRQQKKVLELLARYDNWDVDFRPAVANFVRNPILDWFARKRLPGIRLRDDATFPQLLRAQQYDLIVTDAVATVLLESVASNAQVIVNFDGRTMELVPRALELLKRRAVVSFCQSTFLADIARAMENPSLDEAVDDGFLRCYGLPEDLNLLDAQATAVCDILNRIP